MYEIWFDMYNGSTPYCVSVEGLSNAREAWDRLNREFFMRSQRP